MGTCYLSMRPRARHPPPDKIHLSKQRRGNYGARFVSSPSLVASSSRHRRSLSRHGPPWTTTVPIHHRVPHKNRHRDKAVSAAIFFSAPFRETGKLWSKLTSFWSASVWKWNNNNNSNNNVDNFMNRLCGCTWGYNTKSKKRYFRGMQSHIISQSYHNYLHRLISSEVWIVAYCIYQEFSSYSWCVTPI